MAAVGSCVGLSSALCGSYFGFRHFAGLDIAGELLVFGHGGVQPLVLRTAFPMEQRADPAMNHSFSLSSKSSESRIRC